MRVVRPLAMAWLAAAPGAAQTPPAAAPVERADDLTWKVTGSLYRIPGDVNLDLNVRHQMGPVGGWLGLFHDPHVDTVARVGLEYDGKRGPVLFVPTFQLARYSSCSGVRRSILMPSDSSLSLATRLSSSTGTV